MKALSKRWFFTAVAACLFPSASVMGQSNLEQLEAAPNEAALIGLHRDLDVPRGDVDGDGAVAFPDFLTLSELYGQQVPGYGNADLNLDGLVDLTDYAILSANFGSAVYTPEPPVTARNGNLGLHRATDGQVIISSASEVSVGALEVYSGTGAIAPVAPVGEPWPVPPTFPFAMAANAHRATWAAVPGTALPLDGDLYTPAVSASDELTVRWFEPGSYQVHSLPFGVGDALTGRRISDNPNPVDPDPVDPNPVDPNPVDPPVRFIEDHEIAALNSEAELIALHAERDAVRGDVDGNGVVEFPDFLAMSNGMRVGGTGYRNGDINLDGSVDIGDYAILSQNFGNANYMPEPALRAATANLGLTRQADGRLIVSSSAPVDVGAIELTVPDDTLVAPDPGSASSRLDPFVFMLDSDAGGASWAAIPGTTVSLDGDLYTPATTSSESASVRWFEFGSYQVYSSVVGEGDPLTGRRIQQHTDVPDPPIVDAEPLVTSDEYTYPMYRSDAERLNEFEGTIGGPPGPTRAFDDATTEEELLALHQSTDIPRGDLSGDGEVDIDDVHLFTRTLAQGGGLEGYRGGDFNLDGDVDFRDFSIISANFGQTSFTVGGETERVELSVSVNEDGLLVVTPAGPVSLVGLEVTALGGRLSSSSGDANEPFLVLAQPSHDTVFWSNLGDATLLEGELVTGVEGAAPELLGLRWIQEGSDEVFAVPLSEQVVETLMLGDIDEDGEVGFMDYLIQSKNFGKSAGSEAGDMDGDGVIQFADFLVLAGNYGNSIADFEEKYGISPGMVASIPEPSSGAMLLACLAMLTGRRRRRC